MFESIKYNLIKNEIYHKYSFQNCLQINQIILFFYLSICVFNSIIIFYKKKKISEKPSEKVVRERNCCQKVFPFKK